MGNPLTCFEKTQGMDVLGIAQAAFLTMYPEKRPTSNEIQRLSWQVVRDLEKAIQAGDGRWPKSDLMTSYAASPDIGRSREEAIELVRDVLAYYKQCLAWREQSVTTNGDAGGY